MAICCSIQQPSAEQAGTRHDAFVALCFVCEFCRPYQGACLDVVVTIEIAARVSCMLLAAAKTRSEQGRKGCVECPRTS